MADEKKIEIKKTALTLFREKLRNREELKQTILDGLKSSNSKIRSLATKAAFKLGEYDIIKKNVLPLINSDKSKKVLRSVAERLTRKDLATKMKTLLAKKKAHEKHVEAKPAGEVPKT